MCSLVSTVWSNNEDLYIIHMLNVQLILDDIEQCNSTEHLCVFILYVLLSRAVFVIRYNKALHAYLTYLNLMIR